MHMTMREGGKEEEGGGIERGRKWIRKFLKRGAGRAEHFEKRKRNSE